MNTARPAKPSTPLSSADPPLYVAGPAGRLAVSAFPAEGAVRGVVVAGHAMMCDRRTLDRPRGAGLATCLSRAGLHTYTFDARGHGESDPGSFDYAAVLEDLAAVVAWAHARHPGVPLAILGHSLMGHGALLWLAQAPPGGAAVRAVVAVAGNLWLPRLEPSRLRWLRKRAVLWVMLALTRACGRFPARALRLGSADVSRPFVEDFARWAASGVCQRPDGGDALAGLAQVRVPVLAVLGGQDRLLCHPACGRRFAALVPRSEVLEVPGADHIGLCTSPRSAPAWAEVAEWLVAHLSEVRA